MKFKNLIFLIMAALLVLTTSALAAPAVRMYGTSSATKPLSDFQLQNVGNGDVYYVHSTDGDNGRNGKSPSTCVASLDTAINKCTANQGDVIYLLPGHAESYTAANGFDADVAGITIIGMGEGADVPQFSFADTDATVAIGAASVTFINAEFLPEISEVVTGVSVEAAGDNFKFFNVMFAESTTSTAYEFDEAITVAAGADNLEIDGLTAFSADATGASSVIDLTAGVNNNVQLRNIYIYGDYANAPIYSDKADLEVSISDFDITNLQDDDYCIEFTGAALGNISNGVVRCNAQATAVDPGSMGVHNVTWDDNDTADDAGVPVIDTADQTDLAAILADTAAMDTNTEINALWAHPRCVEKVSDILTGDDPIFTITGGPVRAKIVGLVTTIVGGATNARLQIDTTTPAGTFDLNAGAVAIDNDAAGTSYYNVGATSVFTPVTAGAVILDPVTVEEAEFILPIGTVQFLSSGAQTGAITWYMTYWPLSPSSVVVAAP